MAPEESLWNPQIKKPEQCKLCLMYFHQDICGVCDTCYRSYKKWEYNQPSKYPYSPEFSHCSVARRSGLPAVDDAEEEE